MTDSELQAKREKGLCYRSDEKYSFGHIYKKTELHVLVVSDGVEASDDGTVEEEKEVGHTVELSLTSVMGLITPKTMKVRGTIGQQEVVVLIDCGAT